MAVNFLALPQDSVSQTALKRKFGRPLRGEFTFDYEREQHRLRTFLPRNMTRVLEFHDRKRTQHLGSNGSKVSNGLCTRRCGPYLGGTRLKDSSPDELLSDRMSDVIAPTTHPVKSGLNGVPADPMSISNACLKVKHQSDSFDAPQRRSLRTTLTKLHEDKDAQLFFDISNIRKKLNFKEAKLNHDARPRKRVKRDSVSCHCHVTIWDNRQTLEQKEPIIRKSELCKVTTTKGDDNGYLTDIQLENPFVFKARELRVPLDSKHGSLLGMSDKYFLEVKIIPAVDNVDWPPIPILGKSEGEQSNRLGQLAAEKLQGSLVARYLHLPQAPQPDIPLGVFFLKDGRTHRSKYGMEVNSYWTKGVPEPIIKKEFCDDKIPTWALDDGKQPFGRPKVEESKPVQKPPAPIPVPKPRSDVKITFILDGATDAPRGFRNATLRGFQCPACLKRSFDGLDELRFHFLTYHSKYKFVIEKECFFPGTDELESLNIKISSVPYTRPRRLNRERSTKENKNQLIKDGDEHSHLVDEDLLARDESWKWIAPEKSFDLPQFVNGDRQWAVDQAKKASSTVQISNAVQDPVSEIRRAKGFVPAEKVLPFRKNTATKHPNIRLTRLTDDKSDMYTSISNRTVGVDEDPRSESDDEIDDRWFVEKSLEILDVTADKHGWSDEERLLRRKWNKARLEEKLSHPRYLSDSLIRFVRKEHNWLSKSDGKVKAAFAGFIDELLQRKVINEDIARDVWCILHQPSETPEPSQTEPQPGAKSLGLSHQELIAQKTAMGEYAKTRACKADKLLETPDYDCGICQKYIDEIDVRGVLCCELDCEAPGVWYHAKCARCKIRSKLDWRCGLCKERIAESDIKGKGKEKSGGL